MGSIHALSSVFICVHLWFKNSYPHTIGMG